MLQFILLILFSAIVLGSVAAIGTNINDRRFQSFMSHLEELSDKYCVDIIVGHTHDKKGWYIEVKERLGMDRGIIHSNVLDRFFSYDELKKSQYTILDKIEKFLDEHTTAGMIKNGTFGKNLKMPEEFKDERD